MKNLVKTEGRWYQAKADARKIVAAAHRAYVHAEGMMNLVYVAALSWPVATAAGATSDLTFAIGVVPSAPEVSQQGWQLLKASITSPALLAGSITLGLTWTLNYSRAGAALVPIATYVGNTTPAGDLVANKETAMTVLAAGASMLAGDVLVLAVTHASTGTAIGVGVVVKAECHYGQ